MWQQSPGRITWHMGRAPHDLSREPTSPRTSSLRHAITGLLSHETAGRAALDLGPSGVVLDPTDKGLEDPRNLCRSLAVRPVVGVEAMHLEVGRDLVDVVIKLRA